LWVGANNLAQAQRLEKHIARFTLEVSKLRDKLKALERKCHEAKEKAIALARALMQVQDVIGAPGNVFLKAKLWDDMVSTDLSLSKTKIADFITTYVTRVDGALEDMRVVVGGISFALGT
jgi:hypothetical protein